MVNPALTFAERRSEAERLIELARGLLNSPEEEIVVNYLDHAVEALQIVAECPDVGSVERPHAPEFTVRSMPRAPDRG